MKKILKILIIIGIILSIFSIKEICSAKENVEGLLKVNDKTISKSHSLSSSSKDIVFKILNIVRNAFLGILIIFIVYSGGQMIMSMGKNEEELSKAKRTIWYSLIGIVFITFPIAIYESFVSSSNDNNFFVYEKVIIRFIKQILIFLEAIVGAIAVIMLIITGLKIITSRGRDEKITEAKNKVLWIIIALIFIGFIQAWENFIISKGGLNVNEGVDIFRRIANLALYIAGPVTLLFLVFAGYYYITSNGDEEKTKKGKSIVVNVIIGVIILLCAFVLLNDISLLTI